MVAQLQSPTGDFVTLHVTYLQHDGSGKAPVAAQKKILSTPQKGATKGGAIRLFDPVDGVLGVAEGIETALSLHLLSAIPVWAAYSADNLARLVLPEGLKELMIGVDIDESHKGEITAEALACRVLKEDPGIRVSCVQPELNGPGDLNDELRQETVLCQR